MSQDKNKKIDLPFNDFLVYLKRQGFIIGVDHHLRLQSLLNKLGPDCKPSDLKYLLCPIFATNKKQQQQFYRAFDSYFRTFETPICEKQFPIITEKKRISDVTSEPLKIKKWPYILLGFVLLILTAVSFYLYESRKKNISEKISMFQPPSADTLTTRKDTIATESLLLDTSTIEIDSITTKLPAAPGRDFKIEPAEETSYDLVSNWATQIDSLKKPIYELTFYKCYGNIIRWIAIFTPLIFFLLTEWYRISRRRLVLQKQQGKKPPFVWPIQVETPELSFLKNEQFYSSARQLRQRLKSEIFQIDVDKTISSTIDLAGFPNFQYKAFTKPPEYLILIDLPAYRDHYSHLFDNISTALEEEGIFITRYFYENDPRICFNEVSGERVYLADLQTRFSDNRLIIFGNCEELLDPISGELDRWTSLFNVWRERAILTTEPAKKWTKREIILANAFIILPASLDGLSALVDRFDTHLKHDLKILKSNDVKALEKNLDIENNIIELRSYLREDAFQWLCACAVYPELHWDLTLYLGALPCMPKSLINEQNLLRLIRLPWFKKGNMSEKLRWSLISELDKEKSETIRRAIIDLLEKNPAPKESFAYDNYQLNLVVQKWIVSRKNRKQRKKMKKTFKRISERHAIQDYTVIKSLESVAKSPLNILLPSRLRKIFYREGLVTLGLKTSFRIAMELVLLILIIVLLSIIKSDNNVSKLLVNNPIINTNMNRDQSLYPTKSEDEIGRSIQKKDKLLADEQIEINSNKIREFSETEESRSSKDQISREGESKGLIGLITNPDKIPKKERLSMVIGEAAQRDIGKDLGNINGINKTGKKPSVNTLDSGVTEPGVKGNRKSNTGRIDSSVNDIEQIKPTEIKREEILIFGDLTIIPDERGIKSEIRDPDEVSKVINNHKSSIQYCFQRELKKSPDLKGKLVVRFTIIAAGYVKNAEIISSTLNSPNIENCVLSRIRRWDDFGSIDSAKGDLTFRQVYTFGY